MLCNVNRQLAPAACFLQTGAPHQSPGPTRHNNKQAYLWTLCLWNDASSPCPYRVVSQRNASRRVGFTLLGKCFLRHADVGNGLGPLAGQFGKTALTVSRDELWILTALPVLCGSGALITCLGRNNYSRLCMARLYFLLCHAYPVFFAGLMKWIVFPSAPAHKADALPPRRLILSVNPSGVCCGAAAVVIAFRTSLGSGPRIFQLWSLKPITHLLREGTHKPTWMKAFCATCLGFSTSCLCCNTV